MARRTEISFRLALVLGGTVVLMAGCAGWTPPPSGESAPPPPSTEVDTRVREPAREDSAGVQVYPLQNPAVKELRTEAEQAESAGDFNRAAVLLERALRIQPRDPELLQGMAEVQLRMQDYQQALNFAVQSYDSGPRVGEICSRNWRTISVARERLGDAGGSTEAERRAAQCMNTKPAGL